MQYSHSGVALFEKCKFRYRLRYLDRVSVDPPSEPDNALILGTAAHTGIEHGLEQALHDYAFSYPVITDEHIHEMMKLEAVIPKARAAIPTGGQFEVRVSDKDFIGFIDYLVPCGWMAGNAPDNPYGADVDIYDLYDFKYTGNPSSYRNSKQLHLYKYFWEKNNPGKKIRDMYFLIIPKARIRQGKTETLQNFRKRLQDEFDRAEVQRVKVEFDYSKVIEFLLTVKAIKEETEFPKAETHYLCRYCEYQDYCMKGWDYFMKLPENKRRTIEEVNKRVIWIYGPPFCGKTTFANGFPDPLMLNTDGNIKFVDAPFIAIRDIVTTEGRMTKRTLAWSVFKDAVAELEKKDNTFKTIVVDLLEDCYEHCRVFMYKELGITHESDDSFRAWDKVRGEFLHTLRRLMNLDYENIILISHEDTTRDLTRKSGDKISSIRPNLPEKVAVKVAGMVDVVSRIIADGNTRTFSFKSNEVIFGGGRLKVNARDIPLDVGSLFAVYDEANKNAASGIIVPAQTETRRKRSPDSAEPTKEEAPAQAAQDKPTGEKAGNDTPAEEKPVRRRRKARGEDSEAKPETPAPLIAETDRYFYHVQHDSFWMVKAGEEIPVVLLNVSEEVDKDRYDAAMEEADLPFEGTPEGEVTPISPLPDVENLPHCPDAERIFRQNRESNGEIPLCSQIDAGFRCHKEGGPDSCPLLDRRKAEEKAAQDTGTMEQPEAARMERVRSDFPAHRRRRKARDN